MSQRRALRADVSLELDLPARRPPVFDGRPCSGAPVQLYGRFRGCISLDNVCTQFAHRLISTFSGARIHGYTGGPFFDPSLEEHAGVDRQAPIAVYHGTPVEVPEALFERHPTTVGSFTSETDAIPEQWVDTCNRFDLLLVPSRFCARAFRGSGVAVPILVVPHGLEPEYRPHPSRRPDDVFVFYNTGNSDMPVRKGTAELIRCFRRAFAGRDDVQLRLRMHRSISLRGILAELGVGPDDPLIRLEKPEPLPTADYAAIFSTVHCTVHPSKGEGFGLIPLQSIACETPVIAPCSTGMADYLSDENALVLRNRGRTSEPDIYYRSGSYPLIDEDHLVELLRHVERSWSAEHERVRRAAPGLRRRFTWENALSPVMELLKASSAIESAEERRQRIRAEVGEGGGRDSGA